MTYTPYYRTGGTENFKWQRACACATKEEAQQKVDELRKAGYPAHYNETNQLDAIGLPDTFDLLTGSREQYKGNKEVGQ